MTEEQLKEARLWIQRGFSIRKAAKEVGFDEKTLRNRLKTKTAGGKFGRKKTFTKEQEEALVKHCVQLDKRFFGLTLKSLRFLLFEYAEENKIPHQFSCTSKLAGRDFTRNFMKRNSLSLRVPRKTSVARTMGFNRVQLSLYFENLKAALEKFQFGPHQIYNMDESGVQTVPNKLPKHVAPTGKRDVSKTVAAEQGQTVTAVCAMSATGHYVPPFFIYARKRMNRLLIKGGPTGSDMDITDKGYMTIPTFLTWLEHFKKHTNPSENNPILLILDNHVSHTTLEAVTYAKTNHIHLLTLPPHSSHKTQPLDRNFFGPLKKYYDAAVDTWDVNHPGEVFNVSCVAEAFKIAFQKAGTIENAVQGFRATGIYPLDANKFTDDDFLPAEVTDQEPPNEEEEDLQDGDNQMMIMFNQPHQSVEGHNMPVISHEVLHDPTPSTSTNSVVVGLSDSGDVLQPPENCSQHTDSFMSAAIHTPDKENAQHKAKSPEDIIPIPKMQIRRKRSGRGLKSVLLTSTPHKERLEKELAEKKKLANQNDELLMARKKRKQLFPPKRKSKNSKKKNKKSDLSSTSESDGEMSLHNSDTDLDVESLIAESEVDDEDGVENFQEDKTNSSSLLTNDYAIVKVHGKSKGSFRLYVSKIISPSDGGYECTFFKRYPNTHKFSETQEEAFVDEKDIVLKLSKPNESHNARFHKMISFPDDLSGFTLY